ncbi:glycoside hydrolase family 99-like domain-containing protein [Dinghuibacter silviterrae]|uniref:Glycosyl transferase family WbsX n=1 Tax=Dinghuibacter silviterrae TaxID=1539049 RepID=A0A4R8DXA5_9BACT|nr:glycoside hydrolase family 99-like domain-containing protein [Dinghuibacter silviterrae]TDX02067.1 glycosyl transferase family WbsX [Dinghuibacter silviterrae]
MYKYLLLFLALLALSCKKWPFLKNNEGPSPSSSILAYTIPQIFVTKDYTVGAFYYNNTTFNPAVKRVPVVGPYNMPVSPAIMTTHIAQAQRAGIDYFLFAYRSPTKDTANWHHDSTLVQTFVNVNSSMKFALAYNLNAGALGISNTKPLESQPTALANFLADFVRAASAFMNNPNYMKVNGKTLLYIEAAENMYSNNNIAIYDSIRNHLSALGFAMYLVGMQDPWSPPARYIDRFEGCVDAIYHNSLSGNAGLTSWDRWYVLPQAMDQNWEYSRAYFRDSMGGINYIPDISPACDPTITTPSSTNPVYPRTDSGALFRQLCNVAKMNADTIPGGIRMVLIDSWNQWQYDMQLEPDTTNTHGVKPYGESYLDIVRQEFKTK